MSTCPHCFNEKPTLSPNCPHCTHRVTIQEEVEMAGIEIVAFFIVLAIIGITFGAIFG